MSLYRGAGGASDATDDSTVNAVAGYASAAAASATAANADATLASNSASASAASATAAASSASTAFTYSNNASSAANAANTRATAALNSANAAAASATSASASAGSASSASSQAVSASNSANTSANSAATSATSAASSASAAASSAASALAIYGNTTAMNNAVTAAANSAASAATQASNAAASASNAASSVTEANAAVTSASSYADSAQASANNSQAYATSALAARDATLAAYDSFDDRYLGVKSSNPAVDNDGNPLIAGSLYFNDQTNMMMLYAGGNWVAAYTSGGSPSFGNTVVNGTLQVTDNTTLSGGTANGVPYLNASKVLTTGSTLTFDGTTLDATSAIRATTEGAAIGATGQSISVRRTTNDSVLYMGYRTTPDAWVIAATYASTGAYKPIAFAINDTEQMRLTSTGLGIGTSSPGAKLDVVGNAKLTGTITTTANSDSLVIGSGTGTSTRVNMMFKGTNALGNARTNYIGTNIVGTAGSLEFYNNSTGLIGAWDASGNLGLGVTPSAWATIKALQVSNASIYGNGGSDAAFSQNAYYNAGWKYISSAAAAQFMFDNGAHKWFTAPSGTAGTAITFTQAMTLDASGNLGIGTTSPGAKLHVTTNATGVQALFSHSSGTPTIAIGNSTTNYNLQLGYNVSSEYGYIQATAATGVADDIVINPTGGNLLVGLTSATGSAKLQVSGPIRTTGYTVATLPTGTVGMRTYVTDALTPSFGAAVVGGGAVTIPVFYNGTNWIVA